MPEPELVDEPREDAASVAPAEDAGPEPSSPPDPQPATASDPTYHLAVWDEPPTYICQVCNLQGVDKPTIIAHLETEHGLPAVPTLLAQQVEDGILTPTLGVSMPPPAEEVSDDVRPTDDGPEPGDTDRDDRAADVPA